MECEMTPRNPVDGLLLGIVLGLILQHFTGCATERPCRPCPEVSVTCKDNSPRLRQDQNYQAIPTLLPDFGMLPDGGVTIL